MNARGLLSFILIFTSLKVIAQSEYNVPKIEDLVKIPASPEAQAFAKYGNTQVNLYTGTPDVSIPIATLQGREISIPITLTYDGSGVKVEQIATSAGLGWNLSVGGMISRQTRGNPDDYLTAYPAYLPFYEQTTKSDYDFVNGFTPSELTNYSQGDLERFFIFMDKSFKTEFGKIEIQPDVYSFNALGLSGTLYVDYSASPASGYCMEHPELKIRPIFATGSSTVKVINEWEVTDASGNVYYFGNPETTYAVENNSIDGFKNYYSGWTLYKVETRNKRDVIEFFYGQNTWVQPQVAGRADYRLDVVVHNTSCGNDQLIQPTYNSPSYKITQSEIGSISVNGKQMAIFTGDSRQDLEGGGRLKEIIIYDQNGVQISKHKFTHSYFGPTSPTDEKQVKLRLDALEIYGDASSTIPLKYQFQYFDTGNFPSRNSFAQDYWGYYNGQVSNATLIPYNYYYDKANMNYYSWRGGKRIPSLDHAKVGSLQSITYPTGGSTEFTYQLHRSSDIATTFQEDILYGAVTCIGGTQSTNPYNYCDDMVPTPPYAKGADGAFNIPYTGNFEVKFTLSGTTAAQGSIMQFFGLYRTGPIDCDANGNCNYGSALSFCDLFNASIEKQFYGGLPAPYSFTYTGVSLQSGAYRLLLLNNNPDATMTVEVWGAPSTVGYEAGGLRTSKIVDKDEYGTVASTRYIYYGDLSTVTQSGINESFLAGSNLASGVLHDVAEFEEVKHIEKYDFNSTNPPPQITCYSTTRYSSNRWQADRHVTYPVVTEVQFNNLTNEFNGYSVTEFVTQTNRYSQGFSKSGILSGRVNKKRIFDKNGTLLNLEQTYNAQRAAGSGGNVGFFFSNTGDVNQDLYVKSLQTSPTLEFYQYVTIALAGSAGNMVEQHCISNGNVCSVFNDIGYHPDPLGNHMFPCSTYGINSNHPAVLYYQQLLLQGVQGVTIEHAYLTSTVVVCQPMYNIIYCHYFGGTWQRTGYSFPRSWAVTDSTRTIQYSPLGTIENVIKNFYENTNHFQITRIEHKDSKGVLRKTKLYYPHEMSSAEPSNSIWTTLITQNRITEVAKKEATYGSNQPDFVQNTIFKTITTGSTTMIVPDIVQFSSGTGSLEDRMRYHQYDNVGNPSEVSRVNDTHTSYLWGYNQMQPVAQATNAAFNEIFYTSFEGEEGGNSTDNDCHTGVKSKTGGYSKSLTGLTANKPYVLTYWQKSGSVWSLQAVNISASGATTYNISLSGQVDDVRFCPQGSLMTTYTYKPGIGVTSVTDPNNQSTYYEYDSMGRLWLVKDINRKILKEYKYNYKSPGGTQ